MWMTVCFGETNSLLQPQNKLNPNNCWTQSCWIAQSCRRTQPNSPASPVATQKHHSDYL